MATAMRRLFRSPLRVSLFILSVCAGSGDGYSCPYGQKCPFEPAAPGSAPPCALPGLTYCLHPDPYPEGVIFELVKSGTYDITTLLSDESREEFSSNSWRVPAPRYGPPQYPYSYGPNSLANVDQISLVDYNYQNTYNQAFSQRTPLHPPTAGGPYKPADQPYYRLTNFSALNPGFHTGGINLWGQPSNQYANYDTAQTQYNQNFVRLNSVASNDFYNDYNRQRLRHPGGWARNSNGVTQFNPVEWWRYMNPKPRTEVTIERSISLPSSSSILYPQNATAHAGRRRRRRAAQDLLRNSKLTGSQALRIAFQQARDEVQEEQFRDKRQSGDEVQLCRSRQQYIMPRAALNNKGSWRYVVNMADNMTQLVKAEICMSTECNGICALPLGYTSRCEQKYIQKRLVALQSDGQNLYTDVFWIPSCCQCTIVRNS